MRNSIFSIILRRNLKKVSHGIRVIHKYNSILPCQTHYLNTEVTFRSHLDYGDRIYDQPNNKNFSYYIEGVQYKAVLEELGLEFLKFRRWCRKLCLLFKIRIKRLTCYLPDIS